MSSVEAFGHLLLAGRPLAKKAPAWSFDPQRDLSLMSNGVPAVSAHGPAMLKTSQFTMPEPEDER